jgi:mannose-6-phosphate isomerase-like protein (cupin superfamily)
MLAKFFDVSKLQELQAQSGKSYFEFLRVPAMSAGIYTLAAGAADPQSPHEQDEMYCVVRGRARFKVGSEDQAVGAGSVIFVAAGVEHRFQTIEEELTVLVFFAPAES